MSLDNEFDRPFDERKLKNKENNNDFPSVKVLTISAEAYCAMKGRGLNDYEPRRIRIRLNGTGFSGVPADAEVVVKYIPFEHIRGSQDHMGSGTALIPKNQPGNGPEGNY